MTTLRIVHTPVRAFPHIGGVELHVHNLANYLAAKGHEVTVVAAANTENESLKTNYIRRLIPWLFKITNTEITPKLPLVLMQIPVDIIHSHIPTPWTSDWSMLIGFIRNKKRVLTIHNDMNKGGFLASLITRIYVNTAMRLATNLASRIVIVNPKWQESFTFTKHVLLPHENKIKIIPNAVDPLLFKPTGNKKKYHVLCVSVLDKYHDFKGIPYLLTSFKEIIKSFPNSTLQIVGEGELKDSYQKLASDLRIDHVVTFSGSASQAELVKLYSEASIFVLPSTDTEGFGLVLIEALSCMTPVITTPVAGVADDIEEHQCGLVVPVRDSHAITRAIMRYFKEPLLISKHGKNGRELVITKYSSQKVASQIEDLYLSLI